MTAVLEQFDFHLHPESKLKHALSYSLSLFNLIHFRNYTETPFIIDGEWGLAFWTANVSEPFPLWHSKVTVPPVASL